jgi:hypothetical protein
MLVIVSDLHLTDRTSGQTIKEGAFRVFRERLRDLAYDASWRADGKYRPIPRLDILFAGDILDVIRSLRWCAAPPDVRPWGNVNDPRFVQTVSAITRDILRNNTGSIDIVRSLKDGRSISIPPATKDGNVAQVSRDPNSPDRLPVEVRLHYLLGNHDWVYHLPGAAFNPIRATIVRALGLDSLPTAVFPHDPYESPAIGQVLREHRVVARHGDIFDSMNFEGTRDASSLGDAIVIELLNRFPLAVAQQIGSALSPGCDVALRDLDNVRPLLNVPAWLGSVLEQFCPPAQAAEIKGIWDGLVDKFLALDFVRGHNSHHPFGQSNLEAALKFSRGASLAFLGRVVSPLAKQWLQGADGDLLRQASKEKALDNGDARFVVYGHSHDPCMVALRAATKTRGSQIYLNSGTWKAVLEAEICPAAGRQLVGHHVMTYLTFFKEDERKGRAYETWTGSLESTAAVGCR